MLTTFCRLCNNQSHEIFKAKLIDEYVQYYECHNCGYVQTEMPTWLEKAYNNTINISDTGIVKRNLHSARLTVSSLVTINAIKGKVVDYSGGYGLLVRILRDMGVNAYWHDPYTKNLMARGFEYYETSEKVALVTAFEAFEHYVYPMEELKKLFAISSNILFTTSLIPSPTPSPSNWWYYGQEHGQHIGFIRRKTLDVIAQQLNCFYITDFRSVHFLTKSKISPLKWRLIRTISKITVGPLIINLKLLTLPDHEKLKQSFL